MGYGNYSYDAHRDITQSRSNQSRAEVFAQSNVHPLMNPFGVGMRECFDSADHPNSVPIIFALDVTGSMGVIPEQLAKKELPQFMKTLLDIKVPDPQVMFMMVGDAACDRGPLQIGQFESTAQDMDRWLTWSWLEGGGGGNGSESYEMAMYFAARHTDIDCANKRKKRGYFFMTGDENPYPSVSASVVKALLGDVNETDIPLKQVCDELAAIYHPFFLIPDPNRRGNCEAAWRAVFGDHVVVMESSADTCYVAAALVSLCEGNLPNVEAVAKELEHQGLERQRVGGIMRAVTPFAATLFHPPTVPPQGGRLERDGNPAPQLQPALFP